MCAVCGCGKPGDAGDEHEHLGADGVLVRHRHGHAAGHSHAAPKGPVIRLDLGEAGVELPGLSQKRIVQIQANILGKNDALATANRQRFMEAGTFVVNLMSSPGSGKTTLLTRTLRSLKDEVPLVVIEGDQQTSLDADRIRETGVPAVQINTGKGCHLDASMVGRALAQIAPPRGILFIENVGNLVCPAGFDLGESRRVVVISTTEGEDKPLKYPDMFAVADLVVVNKSDLLPFLEFNVELLESNVRRVKPGVPVLRLSARTGEGLPAWLDWLRKGAARAVAGARA